MTSRTYQDFSFIPPKDPKYVVGINEPTQGVYTLSDCALTLPDGTEILVPPRDGIEDRLIRPNHTAHHYVPSAVRTEMLCPINQQQTTTTSANGLSCHLAGQYNYGYEVRNFNVEVTLLEYWVDGMTAGTSVAQWRFTRPLDFISGGEALTPIDFVVSGDNHYQSTDDSVMYVAFTNSSGLPSLEVVTGTVISRVGVVPPTAEFYHKELQSIEAITITYHGAAPTSEGNYPGMNPGQRYAFVGVTHGGNLTDATADQRDAWARFIVDGYSDYQLGTIVSDVQTTGYVYDDAPLSSLNVANLGLGIFQERLTAGSGVVNVSTTWQTGTIDSTPTHYPFLFGIRAVDSGGFVTPVAESGGIPLDGALGRVTSSSPPTSTVSVPSVGEGSAAFVDNTPLPPNGFGSFENGGYTSGVVDVGYAYPTVYHSGFYSVGDLGERAKRVHSVDVSFDNLVGSQVPGKLSQFPLTFSAHTVALYETGVPDQVSGDVFFPNLYDDSLYNRNTLETNLVNVPFQGYSGSFKFGVWSFDAATWVVNSATISYSQSNNTRR